MPPGPSQPGLPPGVSPVFSPGAAEVAYPSYPETSDFTPGAGYPTGPYPPPGYPPPGYPGYSGYPAPGYPPAGGPRPRRNGLIIALIAGLVVLVLGAGSLVAVLLLRERDTTAAPGGGPSASGSASPTAAGSPSGAPGQFEGDLRELLLAAPSGSAEVEKPISPDGRLTASQIASTFNDPSQMLDVLEVRKFEQGAIREYRLGNDTFVTIKLYQFGDQAKANAMSADLQFGYGRDPDVREKTFIDGIPLGQSLLYKKASDSEYVLSMGIFSKNDITCHISVFERKETADAEAVSALAQEQFAKLP
jgi:hypothetical protein